MRMFSLRRTSRRVVVMGVFAVALVSASGALAWGGFGSIGESSAPVSATFYANTSVNTSTQTCTAANGDSIDITQATFTGTATSSTSALNGPITISAKTVYDTTTALGSLTANVSVGASGSAPTFDGRLVAVDANGAVQGFIQGDASGARVLGNVTATYSGSGFNSSSSQGTIGSGSGTDTALLTGQGCSPPKPAPGPFPPHFPFGNHGHDQGQQGQGQAQGNDFNRGRRTHGH